MSEPEQETPEVEWREEIPDEPPPDAGGEPEVEDQPMGVQPDADPADAPLPGLPEKEPPASE